MTKEEIVDLKGAVEAYGLACTKFPKKLEIKIPRAKFPGIYLSIPTDSKSFKLQVYFNQMGIAFLEKLNYRSYTLAGDDMHKTFSLTETKGLPSNEELNDYLNSALNEVVNIGIVREPELVS